jgi:hypothetical protein
MPKTGPRWMMFTANPTRNWLYRRIIKPRHDHDVGTWNPDLLCERHPDTQSPILDDSGRPKPLIELFESSTYENRHNLPPDFLTSLEATYRGQMRDRFLLGKWVGYEGQVYTEFDQGVHVVPHSRMLDHMNKTRLRAVRVNWAESFDHGIAEPSCYMIAFIDSDENVHVVDGFYEAGLGIEKLADKIRRTREQCGFTGADDPVYPGILADPSIFRRNSAHIVGPTVASMLSDHGIDCTRANNNLLNGIAKVQSYLYPVATRLHPYNGRYGAPRLYISDRLHWWVDEVLDYVWVKDKADELEDKPRDKKNHAMDATRYLLTDRPAPSQLSIVRQVMVPDYLLKWTETPDLEEARVA